MTAGTVRTNVSSAKILLTQMEDAVLECGGADLGVVSRQQTGELAQERSMTLGRIALQASLALDHKRRWKRALHHAEKTRANCKLDNLSGFGDVERTQQKDQPALSGTRV